MLKKSFIFIGLILVTIGIVLFAGSKNTKSEDQKTTVISPQEVKKSIDAKDKITIVDVRTPDEYKTGHIKNSVLLTLDTIEENARKVLPDKNKLLYVYCRSGVRSAKAVTQLQQLGYTNVHSIDGGLLAWQKSGYPVEK
jgi:phage shock protein E